MPYTVRKQPNKDAKTEALYDERSTIEFMSTSNIEEYLSFKDGMSTVSETT